MRQTHVRTIILSCCSTGRMQGRSCFIAMPMFDMELNICHATLSGLTRGSWYSLSASPPQSTTWAALPSSSTSLPSSVLSIAQHGPGSLFNCLTTSLQGRAGQLIPLNKMAANREELQYSILSILSQNGNKVKLVLNNVIVLIWQ